MTGKNRSPVLYCDVGCTTKTSDGVRRRRQTDSPSRLCSTCVDQVEEWLREIPDLYALLPSVIEHGTTERNPDAPTVKRTEAPAPLRLEIVDLLDTRHGLKWHGTAPADDRRGVLGDLLAHVDTIADRRAVKRPGNVETVTGACQFLTRHLLWALEQDWVAYLHSDLKRIHRALSDAVGEYRRPPVGHCHVITDDTDDRPCGGPLFASKYGGVRCGRCHATWDAGQLRLLGLALAETEAT